MALLPRCRNRLKTKSPTAPPFAASSVSCLPPCSRKALVARSRVVRTAAKYEDMTEKLDVFIAESLACKTSLVSLACTDDELQRISLLDSNAQCSSHRLGKYLQRKFDAESSKKQLEDKAAAASKQAARLRRMGVKPPALLLEDPDAAYKTPRPPVTPAMFALPEPKK